MMSMAGYIFAAYLLVLVQAQYRRDQRLLVSTPVNEIAEVAKRRRPDSNQDHSDFSNASGAL